MTEFVRAPLDPGFISLADYAFGLAYREANSRQLPMERIKQDAWQYRLIGPFMRRVLGYCYAQYDPDYTKFGGPGVVVERPELRARGRMHVIPQPHNTLVARHVYIDDRAANFSLLQAMGVDAHGAPVWAEELDLHNDPQNQLDVTAFTTRVQHGQNPKIIAYNTASLDDYVLLQQRLTGIS